MDAAAPPRVLHYVVADDSRTRFLQLEDRGVARWVGDFDAATTFPDLELARKARDAFATGYIAVPVVGRG